MIVINFAHPITEAQREQIESITARPIERIIDVNSQVDLFQPLTDQVVQLVDSVGFTPAEWQTLPILVNPPSLNFVAVTVLAELHGRMGYFPPVVVLRRQNTTPPTFEVAEIVDLQNVRASARLRR